MGSGPTFSEDRLLPNITNGVAAGDVSFNHATIWSRADRPSRMIVEVASNDRFEKVRRFVGPEVLRHTDYTGKVSLRNLPVGKPVFYRVQFQDLDNSRRYGAPVIGQLKTASRKNSNVSFTWSGDTAGQGFGIDATRGGMQTYATIQKLQPDFFVHSGDVCYSDGPFESELILDDGTVWKNLVTKDTSKVAETLREFRANFQYNLKDETVRQFNSHVPIFAQWDDHETTNNWYPGERLDDDDRYSVKSTSLLAARSRQAFFDYMPIRKSTENLIYRQIAYGPRLDLFFLDLRSYRGPNSENRQPNRGRHTAFMGRNQMRWLKIRLATSQATWKFICSDMPIGLVVRDDAGHFDNCANGDGPVLGREQEIAELLKYIKDKQIRNVVFVTADVHYAASHYYDPNLAQFKDFDPFWEFVSGPLHAGTFGPNELDNTFGPQVKFCSVENDLVPNRPPSDGLQFFGMVSIDGESGVANIAHYNRAGEILWQKDLQPVG